MISDNLLSKIKIVRPNNDIKRIVLVQMQNIKISVFNLKFT